MKIFNQTSIVDHFCPLLFDHLQFRLRAIKPHSCAPCIKELLIDDEKRPLGIQMIIDVDLNIRIIVKNWEDSLFLVLIWKRSEA
jgi:hypothetical protein